MTPFKSLSNRQGATLVFVAILLFVIIAFVAIAVDVGHLVLTKNELQNAADAGALAAARNYTMIMAPPSMLGATRSA